ncbi:hypothetical protein SFRURICE_000064 [Spodoptera frugiperda]|nr:hypothetical protein SFRURICE_000064 [Spodoptera frugiperda]
MHILTPVSYKSIQKVSVHRPASYASHVTDFSLSCIETHTTASTDPHRTDRIIGNAYMRCVLMTSYGMRAMCTMRHVFSRSAPTQPAKLTMNTTPPSSAIRRLIFSITSYTVSNWK